MQSYFYGIFQNLLKLLRGHKFSIPY
jgi:hypothetical protein